MLNLRVSRFDTPDRRNDSLTSGSGRLTSCSKKWESVETGLLVPLNRPSVAA